MRVLLAFTLIALAAPLAAADHDHGASGSGGSSMGPTWDAAAAALVKAPSDAERWVLWTEGQGLHFGHWGLGVGLEGWENVHRQVKLPW